MLYLRAKSLRKAAGCGIMGALCFGLFVSSVLGQTASPVEPPAGSKTAVATTPPANITGARADKSGKAAPVRNSSIRLGDGDLVEVLVYNVPELNGKARIDGNGDLYLPLIDYVHVAGLTVTEAQGAIEKRLNDGGFVKNPHVNVLVDEGVSQGVSVLGEVVKPGVYAAPGKEQLLDVISAAGGLTPSAGHVVTVTHRDEQEKPITGELAKNLTNTPETNIDIMAGDTVVVHKADVVYVVGDVARPSGLLIDRGNLTVLQAIALAGGTTATSRPNGARIIHKGPDGMTETPVPLKKILQARAADIPMKPDDILFVPSSVLKTALRDNASIAMQATSIGIIAVK